MHVLQTGIGLSKLHDYRVGEAVVSCGLAGGLRDDLPMGSVLIPNQISRPSGELVRCDSELVEKLRSAARKLGWHAHEGMLLTVKSLVTGSERKAWADRGYWAADMESGLLDAPRLAAIRVILDTPQRDISPEWTEPLRAALRPRLWSQGLWMWRHAPECARRAAAVLAEAFSV